MTYVLLSSHAPCESSGFLQNEPYVTSINYGMDALLSYVTNGDMDGARIIILGDHQPVSELTDDSSSSVALVHVMNRDPAMVAPCLARGYLPGMVPGSVSSPMESFLLDFLRDFSGGAS